MSVGAPLVAVTFVIGGAGWACAGASAITQTAIAEQNNRGMRTPFEVLIDITRDLLKIVPSFRGQAIDASSSLPGEASFLRRVANANLTPRPGPSLLIHKYFNDRSYLLGIQNCAPIRLFGKRKCK